MKKIAACLLLIAALHARADFVIIGNVETDGYSEDLIMKVKGDETRVDTADTMSNITNLITHETIILYHAQKTFRKITPVVQAPRRKHRANLENQQPAQEPLKIIDTGRQEKVSGVISEIYTAESATCKYTFWVAKDWPNAAAVQAAINKLELIREKSSTGTDPAPDFAKLNGVLVKVTLTGSAQDFTITLISAVEQPLDDAEFQIPSDYTDAVNTL